MKQSKTLEKFFGLVKDQFAYGGKKYAHSGKKESTDVLFDDFGKNWLFGTIAKYVKRYSNLARERDLLKIACYMFILWLKRGFHVKPEKGTLEPINTTVDVKDKYFDTFIAKILETEITPAEDSLTRVYELLLGFANKLFIRVTEEELYEVFVNVYALWDKDIKNKGTDLDTWNEEK